MILGFPLLECAKGVPGLLENRRCIEGVASRGSARGSRNLPYVPWTHRPGSGRRCWQFGLGDHKDSTSSLNHPAGHLKLNRNLQKGSDLKRLYKYGRFSPWALKGNPGDLPGFKCLDQRNRSLMCLKAFACDRRSMSAIRWQKTFRVWLDFSSQPKTQGKDLRRQAVRLSKCEP